MMFVVSMTGALAAALALDLNAPALPVTRVNALLKNAGLEAEQRRDPALRLSMTWGRAGNAWNCNKEGERLEMKI